MKNDLEPFFNPKGVAIVGASTNPAKLSYGIVRNLSQFGYKGKIYPVNPSAEKIMNLKCFPAIQAVPDPLDLAILILPAPAIPQLLEDCGKRGIKAATIISGGFREIGTNGLALENECLRIAKTFQMRVIGPNCVGTMNMGNGLDTTFIQGMPSIGGIGFISQSGAVCGGIVDHVVKKNIGFSHLISLGNEADVNETDMIEYLGQDQQTRVIAVYVESIRDGRRFLEVGKEVGRIKPIIILKAGRTSSGAKAVSSHTGSLAGSQAAYSTAFRQAGMIEVNSLEEMLNIALVLDLSPVPKGNRVAIITNAGGPAALASDHLADNNIILAELSSTTKQELRERLNPSAQVENPIDMLGGAGADEYEFALKEVLMDPEVDIAVPILVPQALVNPAEVANAIVNQVNHAKKPVITCFMGLESIVEAREILVDNKIPMLDYPEKLGRPIGSLFQRIENPDEITTIEKTTRILFDNKKIAAWFKKFDHQEVMGEYETRSLFDAMGIPVVAGDFAPDLKTAQQIAERIRYPVVLKIVSPQILHKSEIKGVALNIGDEKELNTAWNSIAKQIQAKNSNAHILGFMVEKMARPGLEVVIGMKRDPNFGAMLMFGSGGIFVELFKDVAFRFAPINRNDAMEMINETHAKQLLNGFRGQPMADVDALIDNLLRLNELVIENPKIEEIEINPLVMYPLGQGVLALDGRMILS